MIRSRGYPGSVVQLRRYVAGIRPQRAEAFLRLETLPGEQAQVDWGTFGKIQVGSAKRALSCFVGVVRVLAGTQGADLQSVVDAPTGGSGMKTANDCSEERSSE